MGSLIQRQFGRPTGWLGRLAGWIMSARGSNVERNRRTVEWLDVTAGDHVLEIGFGPGLSIAHLAELARGGRVVGIDHSAEMLRQASRRNARPIASGLVELRLGAAEALPDSLGRFDKVLAVNVFMFWDDPVEVLRGVRCRMNSGGEIALTLEPRGPGAARVHAEQAAERMARALKGAGFVSIRVEFLHLDPVDAACVLALAPGAESGDLG